MPMLAKRNADGHIIIHKEVEKQYKKPEETLFKMPSRYYRKEQQKLELGKCCKTIDYNLSKVDISMYEGQILPASVGLGLLGTKTEFLIRPYTDKINCYEDYRKDIRAKKRQINRIKSSILHLLLENTDDEVYRYEIFPEALLYLEENSKKMMKQLNSSYKLYGAEIEIASQKIEDIKSKAPENEPMMNIFTFKELQKKETEEK